MEQITSIELYQELKDHRNIQLVNALETDKYLKARIPGSINQVWHAPVSDMLRKDAEVVVYSTHPSCFKSWVLLDRLRKMGFSKIRHYAGGLTEWLDSGYPLTRGGKDRTLIAA